VVIARATGDEDDTGFLLATIEEVGIGGVEDVEEMGFLLAAIEEVDVAIEEAGVILTATEAVDAIAPIPVSIAPRLTGWLVQWRVMRVQRDVTVARGGLEEFGVDFGFAVETMTLPDGAVPLRIAYSGTVLIFAFVTNIFPSIVMGKGCTRLKEQDNQG
jgi:hypothetical protein